MSAIRTSTGALLVVYAAIYPALGLWAGQEYPRLPTFGITPCPLTLFTVGVLAIAGTLARWWLFVIPLVWSVIGGSAAVLLDVPQDWMLIVSGVAAASCMFRRTPRKGLAGAGTL